MSQQFTKIQHMAGIVPVAAPALDFKMPWNDCLMPIGQDYTAIERAVYECALAGCDSIWVVCHYGAQPLIKKRLGEFIADPVSLTVSLNPSLRRRDIAIYYIAIKPKDKDKRDCLSWSILYGADTAYRVSLQISAWINPRKFYCAFPYGIMPERIIWNNRKRIGSIEKTIFRYNNLTIKDGLHMSFTFDSKDYKIARDIVKFREIETSSVKSKNEARYYTLDQVFKNLDLQENCIIDIPWFYDISNWDGYRKYMGSEESKIILKNKDCYLRGKKFTFAGFEGSEKFNGVDRRLRVEKPDAPIIEE